MQATKVRIESDEGGPYRLHVETDDGETFEFSLSALGFEELAELAKRAGWASGAAWQVADELARHAPTVDDFDAYPIGDVKRVEMERAAHGDRGI